MRSLEVFGRYGCPFTQRLLSELDAERSEYVYYDVRADVSALHRMMDINGGRPHVPTIFDGQQVVVGYEGYSSTQRSEELAQLRTRQT